MVSYKDLTPWEASERRRTIDRLLALREGLAREITTKDKQGSFHLANDQNRLHQFLFRKLEAWSKASGQTATGFDS